MDNNSLYIKELSVRYDTFYALNNINIALPQGTFASIVGSNGSGKTTLFKTILGLVQPVKGIIEIFGKAPQDLTPGMIGYVPQVKSYDKSFPAIPVELVASGITGRWAAILKGNLKRKSMEMLERVGAEKYAFSSLKNLSGGELQRVFLARALVRKPKLLLLDEPATGIDLVCEASINELLDDLKKSQSTTILMITHDLTSAYHHSEYVILLNREQVAFGSPEKVFTEINLIKAFSHLGNEHRVKIGMKEND